MIDIPEIIGQDKIIEYFNRCIDSGRIPHAVLLSGESGSGKLEIARAFAKKIVNAKSEEHPDIKIIDLRQKGPGYVETIRRHLVDTILINPYSAEYKIYIIAGAGNMPPVAQNAILKSLEEPPEFVSIIMLTDDISKLLPTIRSRSIKLFIKPVEKEKIVEYLINQGVSKEFAHTCAGLSFGNITKAMSLSNDREYIDFTESVVGVVANIAVGRAPIEFGEEIKEFSEDMSKFLTVLEILLRDVLVYKLLGNESDITAPEWVSHIKMMARHCSYEKLGSIREQIMKTYESLKANVAKDVLMDLLMVEIGGNI